MPDMQSALAKALEDQKRKFLGATISAWDDHEQQIRQPQAPQAQEKAMKTGNMSKDTFDFIKRHPNLYTQYDVTKRVTAMGYKKTSVSAMITQMKKAGLVGVTNERLITLQDEYRPFASPYAKKKPKAKPAKQARPAGLAALAAPKAHATQALQAAPQAAPTTSAALTSDHVLAHIGVSEAHKLYVALGKMFGGK